MCENTINLALRRMGYGPDEMTAHGFRAMAATLLNEMGIWNPDAIERQLAHMENNGVRRAYLPMIYEAEVRHGLPPGLLDALVWAESRYNPLALSPAGAVGLSQLMPGTARDLGVFNRYDPVANIDGGARYLRQMIQRFGSVHLAVAAYNAGPNAVARLGRIPLNGETPTYVERVMRRWMTSAVGTD